MKENITIKNFGGLKNVTIPLNSINIFIGKQASGKSVTAKLIYFFRKIFEDIFQGIIEEKDYKEIEDILIERFKYYFPVNSWAKGNFSIKYKAGQPYIFEESGLELQFSDISIEKGAKNNIKIQCLELFKEINVTVSEIKESLNQSYNKNFVKKFPDSRLATKFIIESLIQKHFNQQVFVPAGRAFFSNIQSSIFTMLSNRNSIDPFLSEFGAIYEVFKNFESTRRNDLTKEIKFIDDSLEEITGAKFLSDKTGDYLIHKDKRKINLLSCSSGQQEILPLALILRNFVLLFNSLNISGSTTYIEEPEAHLFPTAQKKVVEMIAYTHNLAKGKAQLFITTHSPYILTSFNNLLQAGHLLENGANKKKLFKIVPEFEVLKPGELNAYAFENGGVTSLIDEETGLISADMLDQVSEEIAVQFEELLDL